MNTRQYKLRKLSKKKEVLPEYTFGGFINNIFKGVGDLAVGSADMTLSSFGAGNVIGDNAYSSKRRAGISNQVQDVVNPIKNALLNTVVPGLGVATGALQNMNTDKTLAEQKQEQAYNYQLNSAAASQNQGGGSFNNYASMWSMGGVVPTNKKANSAVRNNFMRPNTDKEIGKVILDRGLFGEVSDTTSTLSNWNKMHWVDKKAFIDNLGPDSGISYTTGKGTKTGNPGGVAYWSKELMNTSNPKTINSINKNSSYPQYGVGGIIPGGQPNAELEKNEVTLGPDGTMKTFNLPPHPNSSRVNLEPGTVVFSDNPKLRMPDGQLPAEAANKLKKQKSVAQKALDNPNSTRIVRDTAKRKMSNIDKQLSTILQFQLSKTQILGGNTRNTDGTEVATLGTILSSESGKSLLNTLGSLAPAIYNTIKGQQSVERLNPAAFQNPMAYGALQSIRGRQVDVNPMLTNNAESAAIAESNLRNSGMGAGAYRAGVTGVQNARMKANSAVMGQADIQNNAYLGEYGHMQANLGNQMADRNLMISDLNSRNEAAGRNYTAAAMGQLGQFSQVQQQMNNQKTRDQQLMPMYQSWLEQMTGKGGTSSQSVVGAADANVGFNMSGVKAKYNMTHPKQ